MSLSSRQSSTPTRSPTPAGLTPAEEQPEWQGDLDFGHELKSAVDNILQAAKYIGLTPSSYNVLSAYKILGSAS
jgi:hypothetical protein